jgi:hypothetical protein
MVDDVAGRCLSTGKLDLVGLEVEVSTFVEEFRGEGFFHFGFSGGWVGYECSAFARIKKQ